MAWHDCSERVIIPELLDHANPPDAAASLADLRWINRWFGGYSTLKRAFAPLYGREDVFSVLDVGAGSGDMGRELLRRYPRVKLTTSDYRLVHLLQGEGRRVVADAFRLPFRPGSFDVVFCSLFLHHFTSDQVRDLLAQFHLVARRAVVVIDLERHSLACPVVPWTRWLRRWHPITLHDAPASVRAAFHPEELRQLARDAGMNSARVQRHRPWFRLSLTALHQ